MRDFVDGTAFNFEQGQRSRKLFAAVVLAALDDAIADDKKYGNGPDQIARWARSRDGREVQKEFCGVRWRCALVQICFLSFFAGPERLMCEPCSQSSHNTGHV